MDLDFAQREFIRIRPDLEALESRIRHKLNKIVQSERIVNAVVTGRVKTVGSFSAKVVDKGQDYQPDPLSRMTDKIGLRVELLHLDDIEKVCSKIRAGDLGKIIREEDKRDALGVENIGYQGVHFDVCPNRPDSIPEPWRCVEIQVRTRSQGTWAMANHDISYKSPVDIPNSLRRRLSRMTVFMETFDEEVKRIRDELMNEPDYPIAKLIEELHAQRSRIGRPPTQSSGGLTRKMVSELLGELHDPLIVAHDIDKWMDNHESRVSTTIECYENVGRQFFVDRPEGLLAFFLISTDKYELADRWNQAGYDAKILEDLFLAWGEIVPSSDPF